VGECFFWYRVVRDQRPLNGCVCVCVRACVLCASCGMSHTIPADASRCESDLIIGVHSTCCAYSGQPARHNFCACRQRPLHYNLLIVMVFLVIESIQDRVRFQDLRRLRSGDGHRCRIALAVPSHNAACRRSRCDGRSLLTRNYCKVCILPGRQSRPI